MKKGGDSGRINRACSGMEELGPKKTLTSRAQSPRPLLKPKDGVSIRSSPQENVAGSGATPPGVAYPPAPYSGVSYGVSQSPMKYSHRPSPSTTSNGNHYSSASRKSYVLPSGKTVSTLTLRSPSSGNSKPGYQILNRNINSASSLNPYSRPMSGASMTGGISLLEKSINAQRNLMSAHTSSSENTNVTVTPSHSQVPHTPRNSFLRPQSGFTSFSDHLTSLSPRGSISLNVSLSDTSGHITFEHNRENVDPTKLLLRKNLHDQLLHNHHDLSGGSHKKPPFPVLVTRARTHNLSLDLANNQNDVKNTTNTITNNNLVANNQTSITPFPDQTIDQTNVNPPSKTPVNDTQIKTETETTEHLITEHSMGDYTPTPPTEPKKHAPRPPTPKSIIPRPPSARSVASESSTPGNISARDLAAKMRNLNYTPSRPYSEVSCPYTPRVRLSTHTSHVTEAESETKCGTEHTGQTSESTHHRTQSPAPPKETHDSMTSPMMKKPVYYRKASKDIETLRQSDDVKRTKSSDSRTTVDTGPYTDEETDWESGIASPPPGERQPGDGEASVAGEEDDDEDALDDIADDRDSDAESLASDFNYMYSTKSQENLTEQDSATEQEPHLSLIRGPLSPKEKIIFPALTESLFSNIPPTLHFIKEGEKVEHLSWDIRKHLKWRLSPITPNVVKGVLARVGFRITKKSHDWLGCWGKHMKAPAFKNIREHQKLNHFPGTFQLGRKDRLWRNLCKMQLHFGRREFNFFPQTYVLPFDMKMLKRSWEENSIRQKWIIKPPASARGIGIRVIHKWSQLPRRKPLIVQRYLSRPFLINDSKFDMRVYVYVSCYDPLRIYVFDDGLARFASCKYSGALKSLNNRFMHLTNYSINKKNSDYQSNTDERVCQGHKWSLKSLWIYLRQLGVNTNALWEHIKDLIIKTIICAEAQINSMIKANIKSRYTVHELFGFDILLDENLKPWILEVNISPSLHSNSPLDINIKGQMVKDLFNIAGFHVPDKSDLVPSHSSTMDMKKPAEPSRSYCLDKRLYTTQVVPDEKAKHAFYCLNHTDEVTETILDTLTPGDVRILTESIDEDSRKGMFQRIFPTPSTHKYLKNLSTRESMPLQVPSKCLALTSLNVVHTHPPHHPTRHHSSTFIHQHITRQFELVK